MKQKLSFSVDNVEMIDENPDSNFAVLSLDFFASGKNLHDMYVSEETLLRTADTIKNCPLVWKYDEILDDVYTHDDEEVPCGFVPESTSIKANKLEDGRTMLSAVAYVWKRYTGELLNIFKRDGGEKPVSVEMSVFDLEPMSDGLREIKDFRYEGITILGSYVTPAIPLANASVLSFSEGLKKEYQEALQKEIATSDIKLTKSFVEAMKQNKDDEILTFPYKSKSEVNPALKGISPPVSLSQANEIARQADAIGEDGDKNGWAIAISNFKKTHKVEDGKWVKKENMAKDEKPNKKKEITMEKLKELLEKFAKGEELTEEEETLVKAELAKKEEEENSTTNMSEDKEDGEGEEGEEGEEENFADEDKKPDPKAKGPKDEEEEDDEQERFEYPENFDMEIMATLFAEDEEEEVKMAKAEIAKGEMADPKVVMSGMFAKMRKMAKRVEELAEKNKVYMEENEKLKEFKANLEEQQKNFEIDKTFKELDEKVIIPDEEREEMLKEAEKYSFENIDAWKTFCKAKSFEFATKEKSEPSVTKVGMPFTDMPQKKKNDLWS